jgi:hypothetical protein
MKKAMAVMMLLAGGLCAAPRVTVGIGFGVPAPVVVVRPVCPGPGYAWVDGYYAPNGVWVAGYWAPPAVGGSVRGSCVRMSMDESSIIASSIFAGKRDFKGSHGVVHCASPLRHWRQQILGSHTLY